MHTHELRPAAIRGVEGGEVCAVRVCATRADEDGAYLGVGGEVGGEGGAHRVGVFGEGEVVGPCGGVDEGFHCWEGGGGGDVDGVELFGEGLLV